LRRIDIDLANKPDWCVAISPSADGRCCRSATRILRIRRLLEYLEELSRSRIHRPVLAPARNIAPGSSLARRCSTTSAGFYAATDEATQRPRYSKLERALLGWRSVCKLPPCSHGRISLWSTRWSERVLLFRCIRRKSPTWNSDGQTGSLRAGASSRGTGPSVRDAVGAD